MKKGIVLISFLSVILDRISKLIIVNNMLLNGRKTIIKNFFYITYVENDGAAWNILSGKTMFLTIISFIALIIIFIYILKEKELKKLDITIYGLIIGGIIGNLFDRIYLGKVIDFLGFNIFGYRFPIFNVADTLIVVGIILAIISVFRGDKND